MLNALSALENLAIFSGYKGKTIFGYYSGYAHRNSEKELVNAVILQLEIFRASHSNYNLVYSNYDFPKNLTREEIIKYVKDWKKVVPKNLQVFYTEIINYLQGNSNYSGISDILDKKRKEFGPTTEEDLSRIARSAPYINTNMHKQYEKVKQSYDKTGNYDVRAHLYEDQDDNLVKSQETRRILDRIIGFRLSKLMQSKTGGKSAGRVQSVALKLIVDREREIESFISEDYYTITAYFDGFDSELFAYKSDNIEVKTEEEKDKIMGALDKKFVVEDIEKKDKNKGKIELTEETLYMHSIGITYNLDW